MNIKIVREREGYIVELKHLKGMRYGVLYVDMNNHNTELYTGTKEECIKILGEKYNIHISLDNKVNREYDDNCAITEYEEE